MCTRLPGVSRTKNRTLQSKICICLVCKESLDDKEGVECTFTRIICPNAVIILLLCATILFFVSYM